MQNAKLSVLDLIKKKDLINSKKTAKTEIDVKGVGTFEFKIPTLLDIENSQQFQGGGREDEYIILTCCTEPNLRDKELLEAYEVKEPIDIVRKLFMPGEITQIATEIVKSAGYSEEQVKVIDQVKNS